MGELDRSDLESAVRRVLPALNFEPSSVKIDPGFLVRARRGGNPYGFTINRVENQFVFMGSRTVDDPEIVAATVASEALAWLSPYARENCEHLVVGWNDLNGQAFAAAFLVSAEGRTGRMVAASWIEPDAWPQPTIDASKPADDMVDAALDRLEAIVRDRPGKSGPSFDSQFDTAVHVVNMALERVPGGEGQSTAEHPPLSASDETWASWLYYFSQSVYDEWKRIGGTVRRQLKKPGPRAVDGPLKGLKVFLSYARPDATGLAWPLYEALSSCGADVWYDRVETTTQLQLALGLAESIASCDVYLMCASNEFFERAGYATQEFAWAKQLHESGGNPRHLLVVTVANTVLPSSVAAWPTIVLGEHTRKQLARTLNSALQNAVPQSIGDPSLLSQLLPLSLTGLIPPPRQANLTALWLRIRHVRLFEEIDQETLERLSSQINDDQHAKVIQKKLLSLGEGLEWSGTLRDIEHWPDDPMIKDIRLRFAAARAVSSVRWPWDDDLESKQDVINDVEYLATHRIPAMDWQAVSGWDDGERRLSLRYYAGLLRLLHELLKRGLWGGLLSLPTSTLDAWETQLYLRRRECYDALLDLRLNGRLSWQRDAPTWDTLFRNCSVLLTRGKIPWQTPVPPRVLQLLTANAIYIAGMAAETVWYMSRYGGYVSQYMIPRGVHESVAIEVYALEPGISGSEFGEITENSLRFGYITNMDGSTMFRLSWQGAYFSGRSLSGESTAMVAL